MSIYEAAMNILVANVEAKRWTVNEVHDNKETRKKSIQYACTISAYIGTADIDHLVPMLKC